jgi:hypothetical protein
LHSPTAPSPSALRSSHPLVRIRTSAPAMPTPVRNRHERR